MPWRLRLETNLSSPALNRAFSKAKPQSELERAGSARPEEAAGGTQRRTEIRRRDVVAEPRIIVIVKAANVGDVEKVEDFRDQVSPVTLLVNERLGNTQVHRIEVVAKVQVRVHQPYRRGRVSRVKLLNGSIQLGSRLDLAPQGVAGQNGESRDTREDRVEGNAGAPRPDGRDRRGVSGARWSGYETAEALLWALWSRNGDEEMEAFTATRPRSAFTISRTSIPRSCI